MAVIVTQNKTRFKSLLHSDEELNKYIFRRSFDLILSSILTYIINQWQTHYI